MNYKYSIEDIHAVDVDTVVIFSAEFDKIRDRYLNRVDSLTQGTVTNLFKADEFTGKKFELAIIYKPFGFKARQGITHALNRFAGKKHVHTALKTVHAGPYLKSFSRSRFVRPPGIRDLSSSDVDHVHEPIL